MNIFRRFRALRTPAFAFLFFVLTGLLGSRSFAAGYSAIAGRIYDEAGQEIQIRGISHHGFNSPILQPQFLWAMGWKEQIAQIKALGFNAVRVPFVPDTLYNSTPVNQLSYVDPGKNADLIGKTPLQVLDMWMAEANRVGLYILLDFHSVSKQRQYPMWFVSDPADFNLVYNGQAYTAANWRRDLAFVAQRYANLRYFFAIDVYNEPNGKVRWSSGDPGMTDADYYWKGAVESAASAVLAANPNLLIFVQGITANYDNVEKSGVPMNWGENFQPQAYQPLNVPLAKLVLSPHTYGPDVYMKSSFSAPTFPNNLAADWDTLFGQFANTYAIVPGEWGGRYGNGAGGSTDITWQNAFVDYLSNKGPRNSFYWCYTPNSGDTGGILDDDLNVRADKMALLNKLWNSAAPVTTPSPPTPTPIPPASTPVEPTPPAPTPPQPVAMGIDSFAPTSGPIGTVVTINGRGFTGVNQAWTGDAHNVAVTVLSDTQVQVTIPASATTGAIGIFSPTQTQFTAQAFTVVSNAPVDVQPIIDNFSPNAGVAGTVVTINGTGFTGINQAWVGNAHNATVRVMNDRKMQVTIPAGATTGAIGILNPKHAAFTANSFTVK